MPRFSVKGRVAAGIAGAGVSIDGKVVATTAGGEEWLNANSVVYSRKVAEPDQWGVFSHDGLVEKALDPKGANRLYGGGEVWAAWTPSGIRSNLHPAMPAAGLFGVGPDGTMAFCRNFGSGVGLVLRAPDGAEVELTTTAVKDVQVLGRRDALWVAAGRIKSSLPLAGDPITPVGYCEVPRLTSSPTQTFLIYFNSDAVGERLVVQTKWDSPVGYTLLEAPPNGLRAFRPDLKWLDGKLYAVWSVTEGAGPASIRKVEVDLTQPVKDLRRPQTAPTPVPMPTSIPTPTSVPSPEPMPSWTEENRATLLAYVAKFPLPIGTGEEVARDWTHKLCEQFKFTFGPAWGHKFAGAGRPHSADAVAFQDGNRLFAWDVMSDAGGPDCRLLDRPGTLDITGQVFEVVEATNHIGTVPVPVPPPAATPPPVEPCKFVAAAPCACRFDTKSTDAILVALTAVAMKLDALKADNHKERKLNGLKFVGQGTLSGVPD